MEQLEKIAEDKNHIQRKDAQTILALFHYGMSNCFKGLMARNKDASKEEQKKWGKKLQNHGTKAKDYASAALKSDAGETRALFVRTRVNYDYNSGVRSQIDEGNLSGWKKGSAVKRGRKINSNVIKEIDAWKASTNRSPWRSASESETEAYFNALKELFEGYQTDV